MNGHHIKTARLKAGWSLTALAEAVGLDKGYLSKVENGERKLTLHVAYQAERVLGEPHDSLVRYAEDLSDTVRASYRFPGYPNALAVVCRLARFAPSPLALPAAA